MIFWVGMSRVAPMWRELVRTGENGVREPHKLHSLTPILHRRIFITWESLVPCIQYSHHLSHSLVPCTQCSHHLRHSLVSCIQSTSSLNKNSCIPQPSSSLNKDIYKYVRQILRCWTLVSDSKWGDFHSSHLKQTETLVSSNRSNKAESKSIGFIGR